MSTCKYIFWITYLIIFVDLLFVRKSCMNLVKEMKYNLHSELDNRKCTSGNEQTTGSVSSVLVCAMTCVSKNVCTSFFYNKVSDICVTSTRIFAGAYGGSCQPAIGMAYFAIKGEPYNHALGKAAIQVSDHTSSATYASLATDGSRTSGWGAYTHTGYATNPWWQVDMQDPVYVVRIVIQNRVDCCGDRLRDMEITVGPNTDNMQHCTTYPGPSSDGELLVLYCDIPVTGRYLKIQLMYAGYLNLVEVEVYSN